MKRLFIIVLMIIASQAYAQINKFGYPIYKYYGLEDYTAGEQNWAVVKDTRGFLYVGNNDNGVLEYDGVHWRQIPVSNNSNVRSLAADTSGFVYVGAVGEFGILVPDAHGSLFYKSLLPMVDSCHREGLANVWKTYALDSATYFCSATKVFKYSSDTVIVIDLPEYSNFTHIVDGKMYVGQYFDGLLEYDHDTIFHPVKSNKLSKTSVFVLDKVNDSILLVGTVAEGVFLLNRNSLTVQNVKFNVLNSFLKDNLLYHALLCSRYAAFATLNGGVLVTKDFQPTELYDNLFGLPEDQRVSFLYTENGLQSPLWASLNNGLIKIDWHLPFRILDNRNGLVGHVLDVLRYENSLYVATGSGLYKLEYEQYHPIFHCILDEEVWSLDTITDFQTGNTQLLIGTTRGVYTLSRGGKPLPLEPRVIGLPSLDKKYYVFDTYVDYDRDRATVIVVHNNGYVVFEYKNSQWSFVTEEKLNAEIRSVMKFGQYYWLGSVFNGVFRVDSDFSHLKKMGAEGGLENDGSYKFHLLNDKLYVIALDGLFCFSEEDDRFVRDTVLGDVLLKMQMSGTLLQADQHHIYFGMFRDDVKRIVRTDFNGTYTAYDTAIFKRLPNVQFDCIYPDGDVIWLGCSKGLYAFFPNQKAELDPIPFNAVIRKVILKNNHLLYDGSGSFNHVLPDEQNIELAYSMNDITFAYSAPYFESEQLLLFSTMLEGYDSEWSKWDRKTERVYTNLPSGKYSFKVKVKNVYGVESKTEPFDFYSNNNQSCIEFRVLLPWYLSIYAFVGYLILFVLIIRFFVRLRTAQLERDKVKLEEIVEQRTAEVVKQKDEIELQRDEIADKNQSITDSIHYASRIQQALLPSPKMFQNFVPEHFILFKPRDIVSGDYYWMTHIEQRTVIVAADCTGHGVPGAFMSMLGMSFLNEIVNKNEITTSGEILNELRSLVIESLKQDGGEMKSKDGMDLALYIIDHQKRVLEFSGANNPLYIIRPQTSEEKEAIAQNDESKLPKRAVFNDSHILEEIKADKMPIGIYIKNNPFQTQKIPFVDDMILYTFSDGYVDQFGGPKRRKFMSKTFKELLIKIYDKPMDEQRQILEDTFYKWIEEGDEVQVDDVVVLGVRIV